MNLLNHYDKFQALMPATNRRAALDFVRTQGLPTRHNEDWKYTSLKALTEKDFVPASSPAKLTAAETTLIQKNFAAHAVNVVFVNGVLDRTLTQDLPSNVEIHEASVEKTRFGDSLEALNSLYALKQYRLTVQKETSSTKPVHLILWSHGAGVLSSSFLQIEAGTRSSSQFLISHLGDAEERFSNSVLEVKIGESAKFSLVKVQEENLQALHIARTHIEIAAQAELENLIFSTGAHLGRNTLEVLMKGEGATAQVNGLCAATGTQHVDNNTTIDHIVGHCNTTQLYKGLLDDEARAIFNGKVLIRRQAQKANSEQLNNNLLLSRKAEADSKPMLEIDADDVKASHGSTVGQLNKEELFYLLSRGISKKKAIPMLSYGFLSEVIYKLANEETQNWLKAKLDKAFERLSLEPS